MSFNYAREKRKFDKEWEQLHKEYADAGMSEVDIAQMKAFDWGWFCGERVQRNHTQPLPVEDSTEEQDASTLFRKFPGLSTTLDDENSFCSRYGWLLSIEDEMLCRRLKSLSRDDLELLTMIVFEKYKQAEIARMEGCSRVAIHKRLQKIKDFLKNG